MKTKHRITLIAVLASVALTLSSGRDWVSVDARQSRPPVSPEQQRPVPDPQVVRIRTDLMQIDAVVKDRNGIPVTDLTASDFDITSSDGRQEVEFCTYIKSVSGQPALKSEFGDGRPSREEPGRRIAIILAIPLIDVGVSLSTPGGGVYSNSISNVRSVIQDAANVSRALHDFVDKQVRPADLVALNSTDMDLALLSHFTNDPTVLHASIEKLRKGSTQTRPTRVMVTNDGAQGDLIQQSLAVLETLGQSIVQLGRMPGRKVVVLVSRGLATANSLQRSENVRDRMRTLINEANRAGISIYTIDPRTLGARPGGGGLQDSDSLFAMAAETGGRAIHNTNDIAGGFGEILRENEGYYLLGYQLPDLGGVEGETVVPKEIKVRARRPGLTVQARRAGYAESSPGLANAGSITLRQALNEPFAIRQIGVGLTPVFHSPDARSARITSFVDVGLSGLTLKEETDGGRSASLEMAWRITGPDDKVIRSDARAVQFSLSKEDAARVEGSGLPFAFGVDIAQAGYFFVDVAVKDTSSGRVGNARRVVEVHDLTGRGLIGSTLLLERRSVAGEQQVAAVQMTRRTVFDRDDIVEYSTIIYHAALNGVEQSARLRMTTKLRKGSETLLTSEETIVTGEVDQGAKAVGKLKLTGVPAGTYQIEVVVTDLNNGKSQCRLAAALEVR